VHHMGNESGRTASEGQGGDAGQPLEDELPAVGEVICFVPPPLKAGQFSLRQRFATGANEDLV
jgi:hypothetical protein